MGENISHSDDEMYDLDERHLIWDHWLSVALVKAMIPMKIAS